MATMRTSCARTLGAIAGEANPLGHRSEYHRAVTSHTPAWLEAVAGAIARAGMSIETAGGRTGSVLALATLESGTLFAVDEGGEFWALPADMPARSAAGAPLVLAEAIEQPRDDFEAALAEGAIRAGVDARQVLEAFPFVAVASAALESPSSYLVRLALRWLRPSELREARPAIERVTLRNELPKTVRELAAHLLVRA